jgi:hypothetical protein
MQKIKNNNVFCAAAIKSGTLLLAVFIGIIKNLQQKNPHK